MNIHLKMSCSILLRIHFNLHILEKKLSAKPIVNNLIYAVPHQYLDDDKGQLV